MAQNGSQLDWWYCTGPKLYLYIYIYLSLYYISHILMESSPDFKCDNPICDRFLRCHHFFVTHAAVFSCICGCFLYAIHTLHMRFPHNISGMRQFIFVNPHLCEKYADLICIYNRVFSSKRMYATGQAFWYSLKSLVVMLLFIASLLTPSLSSECYQTKLTTRVYNN